MSDGLEDSACTVSEVSQYHLDEKGAWKAAFPAVQGCRGASELKVRFLEPGKVYLSLE